MSECLNCCPSCCAFPFHPSPPAAQLALFDMFKTMDVDFRQEVCSLVEYMHCPEGEHSAHTHARRLLDLLHLPTACCCGVAVVVHALLAVGDPLGMEREGRQRGGLGLFRLSYAHLLHVLAGFTLFEEGDRVDFCYVILQVLALPCMLFIPWHTPLPRT